jgi:hypothetical protein
MIHSNLDGLRGARRNVCLGKELLIRGPISHIIPLIRNTQIYRRQMPTRKGATQALSVSGLPVMVLGLRGGHADRDGPSQPTPSDFTQPAPSFA